MRRIVLLCSLILIACCVVNAQDHDRQPSAPKDDWIEFKSADGRFSVKLPATPTEKVETGSNGPGPYTLHMFTANGDGSLCMIAWVDYDPSFNFTPKTELEANRDNFVKTMNATLLNSRHTTIGGFQALEFTAETADVDVKSRVFIVGKRPYQIVFASRKGIDITSALDRFFESFSVRVR